jgi:hypothetical protein
LISCVRNHLAARSQKKISILRAVAAVKQKRRKNTPVAAARNQNSCPLPGVFYFLSSKKRFLKRRNSPLIS